MANGFYDYGPGASTELNAVPGMASSGAGGGGGNYFGNILTGLASFGGMFGNIFSGLGSNYQQQMANAVTLAQTDIQRDYFTLAQAEFNRQISIIDDFRNRWGADYDGMLEWATDMHARLNGYGDYDGMSLAEALSDNTTYDIVERGMSTLKQTGTSQIEMGRERLDEQMAARGISKESGLAASARGQYEEGVTNQLSQNLMQYEQQALQNLQQQASQGIAFAAANPQLFAEPQKAPAPSREEAVDLPTSGPRVPGNPMESYLPSYDSNTKTGWMYDKRNNSYFFVKDGRPMTSNWVNPDGAGLSISEQVSDLGVDYNVPEDFQDFLGSDYRPLGAGQPMKDLAQKEDPFKVRTLFEGIGNRLKGVS